MAKGVDEDEHSIEMHLPYILQAMKNAPHPFTIVPVLVVSGLHSMLVADFFLSHARSESMTRGHPGQSLVAAPESVWPAVCKLLARPGKLFCDFVRLLPLGGALQFHILRPISGANLPGKLLSHLPPVATAQLTVIVCAL